MRPSRLHQKFKIKLVLYVLGPVRPRTKYKTNKLLWAEATITLPFVPFPGMFLRMERRRRRGGDESLYLRIRSVEWCMSEERFECTVDEILGDPCFDEALEVRGSAHYEDSFLKMQKMLGRLGFIVNDDAQPMNRVVRYADGRWIDPREEKQHQLDLERWCQEYRRAVEEKDAAGSRRPKTPVS